MHTNYKAIFWIVILGMASNPYLFAQETTGDVTNDTVVEMDVMVEVHTSLPTPSKVTDNSSPETDPPPPEIHRTAQAEDVESSAEESEEPRLRDKVVSYFRDKYNNYRIKQEYGGWNTSPDNLQGILQFEGDLEEAEKTFAALKEDEQRALVEAMKLEQQSKRCLALNGYYEARNQTFDHEVAVNSVVLNRLLVSFRGATTICEVILQPGQFEWVRVYGTDDPVFDNEAERRAWNRSVLIAERLLNKYAPFLDASHGAVYYYNPEVVKKRTGSDWKYAKDYEHVMELGDHVFMKEKVGQPYYINTNVARQNPVIFNGLSAEQRKSTTKEGA